MDMAAQQDEVKHRYEFVRHLYQMFVTMFTVFCVVNITALGWFASSVVKKEVLPTLMVLSVAGLMIVQNALAIVVCWYVGKDFHRTHDRLAKLTDADSNAMPVQIYSTTAVLIACSCGTNLVAWIMLPIVALYPQI